MNILLVTLNVPRPSWGAGTRNEQVLRALARRHDVSLLALVEDRAVAEQDAAELRPLTRDIQLVALPLARSTRRLRQMLAVTRGKSYVLTTYSPRRCARRSTRGCAPSAMTRWYLRASWWPDMRFRLA